MWARIVEVMLGCWLAASPFIFRHPADATFLWANDLACAAAVLTIALLGCWSRTAKLRLLQLGVAAYLIVVAFVSAAPPPPAAYQNYVVLGLLLVITGVIPSRATLPPRTWQAFYEGGHGA